MRKIILPIILLLLAAAIPAYSETSLLKRGHPEERRARRTKSATLTKAEQAFIMGDYEQVVTIGNSYIARRNESDDELQYLTGRALLKLRRYDEARNRFSRVINDSQTDKFLDGAYIGLSDSYYMEGDYTTAKEYYDKVMRYFPDSDNLPIVYYRLGECHSKLGNGTLARDYYNKLVRLYPDSLEAKLLIGEKSEFAAYSIQAGSFTKWSNAKKLCDELKGMGFDANIHTAILGDTRFYRVRVGQYKSIGEAEDMVRTLRNRGYEVKICP